MRKILCAAAVVAGMAGSAQAATFTDIFTGFYSFGDSLSDDGKFTQLDPPSLGGRFSNGPVWAERIEDAFVAAGLDTGNLALGGAVAGNVNLNPAGPLSTFAGQIATFSGALAAGVGLPTRVLPSPDFKPTPPAPGSNPLLSVWFGANDIFQGFDPVRAANAVGRGIRALNSIDPGVFDDFLVVKLPDIGATPAFTGDDAVAATLATNLFNAQLSQQIGQLRRDGLNIISFEPNDILNKIIADVDSETFSFGILNTQIPCTLQIGAPLDPDFTNPPSCVERGTDPDTLLFVDGVHPNAVAHGLFADAVARQISVVPVPAALPLLLTAFAGLGFAARYRRTA